VTGDVIVFVTILVIAGGGGIALGMLIAPRLARLAEPREKADRQDPEEPGADPDRA
jgi:hypothetical protein